MAAKGPLPPTLFVQLDNTARENKNRYVLAFFHMLVIFGIISHKVKLSFLPVGHTHEDVDRLFSRISQWLKHRNVYTLPDFISELKKSTTPSPTVEKITTAGMWNRFLDEHIASAHTIHSVSTPRVYTIKKDPDGVVRHYYKNEMQQKKRTNPNCVFPLNRKGYEMFPKGCPKYPFDVMEIPKRPINIDELARTQKWLCADKRTYLTGVQKKWWEELVVDETQRQEDQCSKCLELRGKMATHRQDNHDSNDVVNAKRRDLRKLTDELTAHIKDEPGHAQYEMYPNLHKLFLEGQRVIDEKEKKARDGEDNENEDDGEEYGINLGVAPEEHWVGPRGKIQRENLPPCTVGMYVIIRADEKEDSKRPEDWWTGRPFWVGKVTRKLGEGMLEYQAYGGFKGNSMVGAYRPAWLVTQEQKKKTKGKKSKKKEAPVAPLAAFGIKQPARSIAMLEKAHDDNLAWWFDTLDTKHRIRIPVQTMIKDNPNIRWPSTEYPGH